MSRFSTQIWISLSSIAPERRYATEKRKSNHPTSPTATPSEGQNIGFVEGNHPIPHVAVISAAQLSAGNAISLDISNGSHSHTVTLTGAQVMQIAARVRVSVESSTNIHSNGADPHAHTVTFN